MNKEEAIKLIGDRPRWELLEMKKALELVPFFNTKKDNKRLEAIKILLKK